MARLVVVGSSNIDMVVKTDAIPKAGETRLGGEFVMVPGGKGANQAVCAAKLGADVTLVARVGDDVFGGRSLDNFRSVGIDTTHVMRDPDHPSGVALIAVDVHGENAIVVAPGANSPCRCPTWMRQSCYKRMDDAVVPPLEIPQETVDHAIAGPLARQARILNPAPMRRVSQDILSLVDVLTPNEHEAAALLGGPPFDASEAPAAARELLRMGVGSVVITLGSEGAYAAGPERAGLVPAVKVKAVDTTAAGDAFTASLACGLAEGKSLIEAAGFAATVAAISVTRVGAQSSMPSRDDIDHFTG